MMLRLPASRHPHGRSHIIVASSRSVYIIKRGNSMLGHDGYFVRDAACPDQIEVCADVKKKNNIVPLSPKLAASSKAEIPVGMMLPKPVRKVEKAQQDPLLSELLTFERKSSIFAFSDLSIAHSVCYWMNNFGGTHDVCALPPTRFLIYRVNDHHVTHVGMDVVIENVNGDELLRTSVLNHTSICLIDAARPVAVDDCMLGGAQGVLLRGTTVGLGASNRWRYLADSASVRVHFESIYKNGDEL